MNYYNEVEIPNHRVIKITHLNKNKNRRLHRSTDNIFETYQGYTLHTIYNKFLVNPYLVRNTRYQNALNDTEEKSQTLRYRNRYFNNKNLNNISEPINNIRKDDYYNNNNNNNNFSESDNKLNYENKKYYAPTNSLIFPQIKNDNINNQNEMKHGKLIRKKIIDEENKNAFINENNYHAISSQRSYIPKYPIINIKNKIAIERPIEYNIKKEKDFNDSFYTNNNNKLFLSYDKNKRSKYLNKSMEYINNNNEYISPVIAKIAKHNYLMRNPYSDKDEYLGPSRLRNNPILYPISTYKFDFNRYIRDYHVNKFA